MKLVGILFGLDWGYSFENVAAFTWCTTEMIEIHFKIKVQQNIPFLWLWLMTVEDFILLEILKQVVRHLTSLFFTLAKILITTRTKINWMENKHQPKQIIKINKRKETLWKIKTENKPIDKTKTEITFHIRFFLNPAYIQKKCNWKIFVPFGLTSIFRWVLKMM